MALGTEVGSVATLRERHVGGRHLDAPRDDALRARATNEHPLDSRVMVGLVSAMPRDLELREVFDERLFTPHLATLTLLFERAVARGEIAPVKDLDTLVSIVPALVVHRVTVMGSAPDEQFLVSISDQVVLSLVQAAVIASDLLT
jgi:hypothetical protein